MVRTRVGYAGGHKKSPNYHDLGDHTETVQVDYDPEVISYAQLLEVFFAAHRPVRAPWSRQYRSAIFYHDEEQLRLAEEARAKTARTWQATVYTAIEPAGEFYRAEDYHQKYRLRNVAPLARELLVIYPKTDDFVDSTAVTRINGYLAGFGSVEQLEKELASLGLSEAMQQVLRKRLRARPAAQCGG